MPSTAAKAPVPYLRKIKQSVHKELTRLTTEVKTEKIWYIRLPIRCLKMSSRSNHPVLRLT